MTVNNTTATLNEPLQIYQHDRGIILRIKVLRYKYTYGKTEEVNMLADSDMFSARAILLAPNGRKIGLDRQPFEDDCVIVNISHDMTDELAEVGKYKLQIQLYGIDHIAERVTLPPVEFIVASPICIIQEDGVNSPIGADIGFLDNDYIVEAADGEGIDDGNLPYGIYDKTTWYPGDVLTAEELNKSEKAIEYLVRTQKAKAIYYPEINADGILSWTNDLDLENPDPVSIIGPEGPVGPQGEQGPKGDAGTSIKIIGQVTTAMELQQYLPTAQAGDSYLVTLTGEVWTYADTGEFINLGAIQGPQGEKGDKGDRGDNLKYSDLTDEEVQELREGFVSYESLVASKSLVRIEIVTQYPTNEEEGVLYIRVEE
jgi:hypothetical protein